MHNISTCFPRVFTLIWEQNATDSPIPRGLPWAELINDAINAIAI